MLFDLHREPDEYQQSPAGRELSRGRGGPEDPTLRPPVLFAPAVEWLEARTGVRVIGVMPWVEGASIAGEDSLGLRWGRGGRGALSVGVIRFPGISNFTDLDPFESEPDVDLVGLDSGTPLKMLRSLDAVILPGSKNSMWDMSWLRETGLAETPPTSISTLLTISSTTPSSLSSASPPDLAQETLGAHARQPNHGDDDARVQP